MTFNSSIESHVSNVFLNTSHFAESITFKDQRGHSAGSVTAIVFGEEYENRDVDGYVLRVRKLRLAIDEDDLSSLKVGYRLTRGGETYTYKGESVVHDGMREFVFESDEAIQVGSTVIYER